MKINLPTTPIAIFFMFVAIFALLLIGPLLTIWSLNALFPLLAIPYNFFTWVAALWLGAVLSGGLVRRSKE
jgi:uncharacterized membrane protein YccC